jgi:hypothetical protein
MHYLLLDLPLLTVGAYSLIVGTVLLTVSLYADRSYVDGSSCVVLIIDATYCRAVCLPSHHSWRGRPLVRRTYWCPSAQSVQEYIKRCRDLLYTLLGKGNTVGVSSCVSSTVMGLAPSSERQGGELHELT